MRRLLGLETEYGLYIQGRGAGTQIEDARELVAGAPFGRSDLWDYRAESPRADLRGFSVDKLTADPRDAAFDKGRKAPRGEDVRADRILPNGARFYNDHGHPEYATPECLSLDELVRADVEGQFWVLQASRTYAEGMGKDVRIYKNNTDFNGASYGTHESYLVPRELGYERLYRAVTPMLVARQILCGAGKVGSEHGKHCAYQISQRADFFTERESVDTLYRRPVFNTRDEPHADAAGWIRLHVIAGDANMIPGATWRKVGLIRLALMLEEAGEAPCWRLADPVQSFEAVSKDESMRFEIPLEGRSWTTAYEIIESYLAAWKVVADGDEELEGLVDDCAVLLNALREDPGRCVSQIDWLLKRSMLEQVMESSRLNWAAPELRSYDLEYHNIDPDEGLSFAMAEVGWRGRQIGDVGTNTSDGYDQPVRTRARARGLALGYPELVRANWKSLTFEVDGHKKTVELDPERDYAHLREDSDVVTFIESL